MTDKVVFFDGVCNLCNSWVQWLIKRDKKNVLYYSSLQSSYATQHITDPEILSTDSIVFFVNSTFYTKSSAVFQICKQLAWPYRLVLIFYIVPGFIRDYVYDTVAKNRYKWFGKRATCMVPDASLKSKFLE
jgi:predicted DCC family thiol-disulfide oxidoreductase YuxK